MCTMTPLRSASNDPAEKREAALRMGVNLAVYALTH